jgi:hypothetical protein
MFRWNTVFGRSSHWVRSLSSVQGQAFSSTSASSRSNNGSKTLLATALAVGGVITYSLMYNQENNTFSSSCAPTGGEESHSVTELAMLLKEKLLPPRERLKKMNKAIPAITIRVIPYRNKSDGTNTDIQVIDTTFDPDCNIIPLFCNWIKCFEDSEDGTGEKLESKVRAVKDFYSNTDKVTLPFISEDKKKSMTITKFISGNGPKISITMFKDTGYKLKDIEAVVTGYTMGFCEKPSKENESLEFHIDDDSGQLQDRIFRFLDGKQPFSRFTIESWNENNGNSNSNVNPNGTGNGSAFARNNKYDDADEQYSNGGRLKVAGKLPRNNGNSSSSNTEDPLEELRALGVEVFDASNNTSLDWDYLAGYDYVKKNIQDTIINSIKFPEVYEEIARKTRLHYESNRPKAVLLEGPPGTGIFLTSLVFYVSFWSSSLSFLRFSMVFSFF